MSIDKKVEVRSLFWLQGKREEFHEYALGTDGKMYRPSNVFAKINPQHEKATFHLYTEDDVEIARVMVNAAFVEHYK